MGLPGVPFAFSLWEKPWTPARCWMYPRSYRQTVLMGLLCRPRDASSPSLPTEVWVKHIFPWCPKWWFETSTVSTPGLAPHRAPPLPAELPALTLPCKAVDDSDNEGRLEHSDDDGASTRAPSSAVGSAHTTPENGPSPPPPGAPSPGEVEMGIAALQDAPE